METGIKISTPEHKDIAKTLKIIKEIMDSNNDQKTKRKALATISEVCSINNVSISDCTIREELYEESDKEEEELPI